MTTNAQIALDERIIPEWELSDRMQRSLRLVNLSGAEVAGFLGVSVGTVSRWLNGRTTPAKSVLMIWSDMTGVDLAWLQRGELCACRDSNPKPSDP